MIIQDRDGVTLQPLDEGTGLGLHVQYRNDKIGVDSQLYVVLDGDAQERLLEEWLAIRFKQQGHRELARRLREYPVQHDLMSKVLAFVSVQVSA